MGTDVQNLIELLAGPPPTADREAALSFLRQPDLVAIIASSEPANRASSRALHQIYRIHQKTTTAAGILTYGFDTFLSALEKMPADEPVTLNGYSTAEWFGAFWTESSGLLVGYVLVKRRNAAEEAVRKEEFQRHFK